MAKWFERLPERLSNRTLRMRCPHCNEKPPSFWARFTLGDEMVRCTACATEHPARSWRVHGVNPLIP
jgi:DNA-directed RNA polymerase subunit RPC12/RpoP